MLCTLHIFELKHRSVDKADSKTFQFNFASFPFIVISKFFFSKHFICMVAYFTVRTLLSFRLGDIVYFTSLLQCKEPALIKFSPHHSEAILTY